MGRARRSRLCDDGPHRHGGPLPRRRRHRHGQGLVARRVEQRRAAGCRAAARAPTPKTSAALALTCTHRVLRTDGGQQHAVGLDAAGDVDRLALAVGQVDRAADRQEGLAHRTASRTSRNRRAASSAARSTSSSGSGTVSTLAAVAPQPGAGRGGGVAEAGAGVRGQVVGQPAQDQPGARGRAGDDVQEAEGLAVVAGGRVRRRRAVHRRPGPPGRRRRARCAAAGRQGRGAREPSPSPRSTPAAARRCGRAARTAPVRSRT